MKPTHVLNAAGLTGRPNVDWCEDHKVLTASALVGNYECSTWYQEVFHPGLDAVPCSATEQPLHLLSADLIFPDVAALCLIA